MKVLRHFLLLISLIIITLILSSLYFYDNVNAQTFHAERAWDNENQVVTPAFGNTYAVATRNIYSTSSNLVRVDIFITDTVPGNTTITVWTGCYAVQNFAANCSGNPVTNQAVTGSATNRAWWNFPTSTIDCQGMCSFVINNSNNFRLRGIANAGVCQDMVFKVDSSSSVNLCFRGKIWVAVEEGGENPIAVLINNGTISKMPNLTNQACNYTATTLDCIMTYATTTPFNVETFFQLFMVFVIAVVSTTALIKGFA